MNAIKIAGIKHQPSGRVQVLDNDSNVIRTFEAATAAAVVAALAELASDYLKGKKLEEQFGKLEDGIAILVTSAVAELKRFVRQELDSREIIELQKKFQDAVANMKNWEHYPDPDYLKAVYDNTSKAESRFKIYGAVTIFCYCDAVSLLITYHVIRYTDAKSKNDPHADGHLQNARDVVSTASPYALATANEVVQAVDQLSAGVTGIEAWTNKNPHHPCSMEPQTWTAHARFYDNGSALAFQSNSEQKNQAEADAIAQATSSRNAILARYASMRSDAIRSVVEPISLALKHWEDLVNGIDYGIAMLKCPNIAKKKFPRKPPFKI